MVVEADPSRERLNERPWDKAARTHWFWSEVWKVRREFWPVMLAALVVNLLALALPLVHDERLRPRHPEQGRSRPCGCWRSACCWRSGSTSTLRIARSQLVDEIGRKLDAKYSQKLFEKVMNLPMAERQGSTGAFAKRVSEYESVRDFFASTTVVLVVDIVFLLIFLVLIAVLAGWLVMVPIVAIAITLIAGLRPATAPWARPRSTRRPIRASSIRCWSNRSAGSRR